MIEEKCDDTPLEFGHGFKIVSSGAPCDTFVYDLKSGKMIENVTSFEMAIDKDSDYLGQIKMTFEIFPELPFDAEIKDCRRVYHCGKELTLTVERDGTYSVTKYEG